ncbi:hypothetical protein [Aeromicrobium stalagmiti]|uniref:hypothetical protein n=1 Tax=Aeromicrobium stalagmiti TaxID=2738988 RepID=UPI001567E7E7|nr:hypothetical protein [Aeromicrobium stalagmiti]NRQ50347.1 hypothetical protein [Aeromicrobium stalagmiti]
MRRHRILVALSIVAAGVVGAGPAQALSCAPIGQWRSDALVLGTVAAQRDVSDRGVEVRLRVDEVWSGDVPAAVWLTYQSLYPDPFPQVGRAYVVAFDDDRAVSNCSIVSITSPAAQEARPDVVRPPTGLGWASLMWWQVGQALTPT